MAQSKNFVDHVKKELECSVCQEQFSEVNEPKILKCLHTFCKTCLEAWLRRQREGELSCPTCRQITECSNNINSLPSNFFYKQMVDIVEAYSGQAQETNSPRCGNCEEKKSLKFYCFDCNNLLCEDCAGAHKKWKSFRGHTFKEIGSFESTDLQDYARKTSVCKKHKDELRFYCERCKICICRDCAILDHRDDRTHNITSFEQALENKQSDITQKMQDVNSIGCRVRDKKESLEKRKVRVLNSVDQSADDVHRFAEHWISLIRQHESTMTKELLEQKENVEAAFSAQMTGLDEKLTEINSSLEFGKGVLERKNLLEIVNVEEIMEQRFQDLLSSRYEFQNEMNVSRVRFVPDDTLSMKNPLGKLFITNADPSLSIALGKGLAEGLEGDNCTFMIITNDSHGQATYSVIDKVTVDIRSMKSGKITKPSITDLKNGRYLVTYKPETTGEFNVSITVAGETLKGSPFKLNVKERISTSQERKDVKRESSVAKRVLECSHMQEESKLKLRLFVPKEPPEVFEQVKARVNFETFLLSPQQSRDILDVIKENTKVAVVDSNDSKDCNVFIVSGTFGQIEAAHKLLQFLINQKAKGETDAIKRAQTQQDYSNGLDKQTNDTSNITESISFEVQPQFMKLLKRVYKTKLKEIEENFCVQIVSDENTSQVCISPREMSIRQNRRLQESCDAFIDLYQNFHPNMRREEVELPNGTDEARIIKAVSLAEAEDPVIIEQVDKNLVVYAEKNSIRSSVESLKEKLGLTNDGNSRKTKRGQGNKRRDAR